MGLPLYLGVKDQSMNVQLEALKRALQSGPFATVEYLLDESMEKHLRASPYLFKRRNAVVEYFACTQVALLFVSRKLCVNQVVECAVRRGKLDVMQSIQAGGAYEFTSGAMVEAAAVGSLSMVRFLHNLSESTSASPRAMDYAAANGYLHVVKILHAHGLEGCTTDAMHLAATYGHARVVKFLHGKSRKGCTAEAFSRAAKAGHLEVVRYLWHQEENQVHPQEALEFACNNCCNRKWDSPSLEIDDWLCTWVTRLV